MAKIKKEILSRANLEKKTVENIIKSIKHVHDIVIHVTSHLENGKRVEVGIREEGNLYFLAYKIYAVYLCRDDKWLREISKLFKDMAQDYHIFVDGNKRTSYLLLKLILMNSGFHLRIGYYASTLPFILETARGEKTIEEIEKWIQENTEKIPEEELETWFDNYFRKWVEEFEN